MFLNIKCFYLFIYIYILFKNFLLNLLGSYWLVKLMEIELNQYIVLGNTAILTVLNLAIHKYDISFYFFSVIFNFF